MKELQKLIDRWNQEAEDEKQYIKECEYKDGRLIHSGEYRRLRICANELALLLKKRSSKRRRSSPVGKQSNVRKADSGRWTGAETIGMPPVTPEV